MIHMVNFRYVLTFFSKECVTDFISEVPTSLTNTGLKPLALLVI